MSYMYIHVGRSTITVLCIYEIFVLRNIKSYVLDVYMHNFETVAAIVTHFCRE